MTLNILDICSNDVGKRECDEARLKVKDVNFEAKELEVQKMLISVRFLCLFSIKVLENVFLWLDASVPL